MQYQGLPFVYGFTQIGFGCGLVAPKAAASTPFGVFWMESGFNFFVYDGSVRPLDCLVRDKIFGNVNLTQINKIHAGLNSGFNEVFWFYPSLNSAEIDSYLKYNYVEHVWDYGQLSRTAWEDHENFLFPMATDANGFLYNHEAGVDADGAPMDAFAQTGYMMLGEGDDLMFVERLIPDLATFAGPLQVTVFATDHPNTDSAAPIQYGPFTVTPGTTPYLGIRARGRGVALKLESNVLGGNFRLGATRARIAPAGRR
jgi:hypothetical protein